MDIVFGGSFDKRLLIRDVLIIIFQCPVVTVSDKHVCKTKQMFWQRIKCIHQLKLNNHSVLVPFI